MVILRLGVVESALEGLGRGRIVAEQPECASEALEGMRPLRPGLCPFGREGKARRTGRVAGGRLRVTQLGQQL